MNTIGDSLWQVSSGAPGPSVVVIGGTHGNERTGIEVVRELVRGIEGGTIEVLAGTLTLAIGNPKAAEANLRWSEGGKDLNRCFVLGAQEGEDGSYECQRANLLKPLLETADVCLDIHATNKPSVPFLAGLMDDRHRKAYQWFRADRVLADPQFVLGGRVCTTDEFVDAHGGIGICYETGLASDTGRVKEVFEDTLNLLRDCGVVGGEKTSGPIHDRQTFELVEPILLTEQGFRFEQGFGEASYESFRAGQVIGWHGDVPLRPSYEGVVVFPKIKEHQFVGSSVAYLAKHVF